MKARSIYGCFESDAEVEGAIRSRGPGKRPVRAALRSRPKLRKSRTKPRHHLRIVSAASLFDGHDAAINVMRRLMQSSGAEVIHLGHNRSVSEVVNCAIQEDVQAIAITSYQGGHVEYFKYMIDLLRKAGAKIEVFGGGGGTILPSEIEELHKYGVSRIYSPDDGPLDGPRRDDQRSDAARRLREARAGLLHRS